MAGQLKKRIHEGKARPVQHLNEASLARIERYKIQTLVLQSALVEQLHDRFRTGTTHTLDEKHFGSEFVQIADGTKGIFEMVQESDTQNQVVGLLLI
jgi:hypothetical protein